MRRFRVILKGAPVFLVDEVSGKLERLGFYTTRWVRADSDGSAMAIARHSVLEEIGRVGAMISEKLVVRQVPPDNRSLQLS